jgi:hypothetical protein
MSECDQRPDCVDVESNLQDSSYESSAFNRGVVRSPAFRRKRQLLIHSAVPNTSAKRRDYELIFIGARMSNEREVRTKKLMASHEKRNFNHLDDFLFTVAESIEEAFLRAGAQPGKDYNYRDLFTLAAPFALEQWKKDVLVIPFWEELERSR